VSAGTVTVAELEVKAGVLAGSRPADTTEVAVLTRYNWTGVLLSPVARFVVQDTVREPDAAASQPLAGAVNVSTGSTLPATLLVETVPEVRVCTRML
jgi:hypothetical protein